MPISARRISESVADGFQLDWVLQISGGSQEDGGEAPEVVRTGMQTPREMKGRAGRKNENLMRGQWQEMMPLKPWGQIVKGFMGYA